MAEGQQEEGGWLGLGSALIGGLSPHRERAEQPGTTGK